MQLMHNTLPTDMVGYEQGSGTVPLQAGLRFLGLVASHPGTWSLNQLTIRFSC